MHYLNVYTVHYIEKVYVVEIAYSAHIAYNVYMVYVVYNAYTHRRVHYFFKLEIRTLKLQGGQVFGHTVSFENKQGGQGRRRGGPLLPVAAR